jgi:calcineurin-like phosphoesterase family protein
VWNPEYQPSIQLETEVPEGSWTFDRSLGLPAMLVGNGDPRNPKGKRRFKKNFDHFRPSRVPEIDPAAQSLIDAQIATEREVCKFLGFARTADGKSHGKSHGKTLKSHPGKLTIPDCTA